MSASSIRGSKHLKVGVTLGPERDRDAAVVAVALERCLGRDDTLLTPGQRV